MSGGQMETPARGQAQPGQGNRYAEAAGTPNIAQGKARLKRAGIYIVTPEGGEPFTLYATFAATLDPATLAALGMAGARIWGALT